MHVCYISNLGPLAIIGILEFSIVFSEFSEHLCFYILVFFLTRISDGSSEEVASFMASLVSSLGKSFVAGEIGQI